MELVTVSIPSKNLTHLGFAVTAWFQVAPSVLGVLILVIDV